MAAYNEIVVTLLCPSCMQRSEVICQTYVASSFSGDDSGGFCSKRYCLGDKMNWWKKSDERYLTWRGNGRVHPPITDEQIDEDCTIGECSNCHAELYVIIQFEDLTPMKVIGYGLESEWPKNYVK